MSHPEYFADEPGRYDPTGEARYREVCKMFNVVPVSYFLRNIRSTELNMMHHGLGPQVIPKFYYKNCS